MGAGIMEASIFLCFLKASQDASQNLAVAHPQSGSSSTASTSNWNLEMSVFEERGKLE